jgi:hypothetical protein
MCHKVDTDLAEWESAANGIERCNECIQIRHARSVIPQHDLLVRRGNLEALEQAAPIGFE